MAQSINTIYQNLLTAKAQVSELDGLTSNSSTAVWRLIYYTIAVVLNVQQQLFDLFIADIETKQKQVRPMSAAWWANYLRNFFQYNTDPTKGQVVINEDYTIMYEVEDADSRILKYVSVIEDGRNVYAKVAKESNGEPVVLDEDELSSVRGFVTSLKFAGTTFIVNSFEADSIYGNFDVYYDLRYPKEDVKQAFITATTDFCKNLGFDGKFIVMDYIVYIKTNVKGVKNLYIRSLMASRDGDLSETQVDSGVGVYVTKAGYCKFSLTDSVITMEQYL